MLLPLHRYTSYPSIKIQFSKELRIIITYLSFLKEIRKVLHSIASNTSHILKASRMDFPQGLHPLLHVGRDFHSDLHPQHQRLREERRQLHYGEEKSP
jgi:hypothetical protein